jgi:hypothetical protein
LEQKGKTDGKGSGGVPLCRYLLKIERRKAMGVKQGRRGHGVVSVNKTVNGAIEKKRSSFNGGEIE